MTSIGERQHKQFEFHLISDGKHSLQELVHKIAAAAPYVDYIHLREKEKSAHELYQAVSLLDEAGVSKLKLIVNDRVDAALASGAAGVQLTHRSLPIASVKKMFPHLKTGKSVHSPSEAKMAETDGADFLLFGHIFTSSSKPGLVPHGLKKLSAVVKQVEIPVMAIGGIQPAHVNDVLSSGANGIAVMSGVFSSSDADAAAANYRRRINHDYYC